MTCQLDLKMVPSCKVCYNTDTTLFFVIKDIVKADNTGSGGKPPGPSGASAAPKKAGYGQPVHYIPKSKYPKPPLNKIGETSSSWVVPQGGSGHSRGKAKETSKPYNTDLTPKQSNTNSETSPDKINNSDSPTPEEHQKLSELASEAGNTKLAEKHKKLAGTPRLITNNTDNKKDQPKIPNSDAEKAQNLIHNSKASEAKKKAKDILNHVPSTHKPAVQQIIQALEDHETKPHIPNNDEKKELRELTNAVNTMAKPIEQKRKQTQKDFDTKIKEKNKDTKEKQKLILRESKDKVKAQDKINQQNEKQAAKADQAEKKQKERFVIKEEKTRERETKEASKMAKKKEEAYNKLKEKLSRDVQKPKSAEEDAQLVSHSAEAKELVTKLDEAIAQNQGNPDLTKLLEAHRRVAANHAQLNRLPKKEDTKALKDAKNVVTKQEKEAQKQEKELGQGQGKQEVTNTASKPKKMNAYNTGRSAGENLAHQGAQDDAGANVTGQAVGGAGRGVASASHHLLGSDEKKKTVKKDEPEQSSMNKAMGNDSDIDRNEDTFDDGKPTGLTSDQEDSDFSEISKAISHILIKSNTLENEFLSEHDYRPDALQKSNTHSKYSKWLCNKLSGSLQDIRKSL